MRIFNPIVRYIQDRKKLRQDKADALKRDKIRLQEFLDKMGGK